MKTTRTFARHFTVLAATIGLMVLGLVLTGRADDGLYHTASAAVGDHLQIAPANSASFGGAVDGVWSLGNVAAGASVTGAVQLRTTGNFVPSNTTLQLDVVPQGQVNGSVLQHLFVTQMSLGGADALTAWPADCYLNGKLAISAMISCQAQTAGSILPTPPGGAGATFLMTLQVDPDAANELQGQDGGSFMFIFTLTDTTVLPIVTLPQSTATPGGASTSATPTATGTAATSPTPSATVAQATTGFITVRHSAPAPLTDKDFTLSVSGEGGFGGPGPEQRSGLLATGSVRTISLSGPEEVDKNGIQGRVAVDSVVCLSDKRGRLEMPAARSVQVSLIQPNETIICTFSTSIAAGVRQAGPGTSATPGAPATGSGWTDDNSRSLGPWLIVAGLLLVVGWGGATVVTARKRAGR